jgi:26S proteasome regulatory subunit N2
MKRLLKFAVSDTSDDVKRAALMNLGFINFRNHQQLPQMVKHLAESYNPHLRYGSALALGIGCAGSGSQDALRILAPLSNDKVDFVRQGALIALAMVFIQVTEA